MNAAWISKLSLIVAALALTLVAGCQTPGAHAPREGPSATRETACTDETMRAGFASDIAQVNGTTLHYVSGGQGPALILIHGFPENWSAYAKIMPRLASRFRVVAIDLRGIGGSTPAEGGYDVATMAEDVHQLGRTLRLARPYVVGHDLGGLVAYALARLHPDAVRGVMILDVPVAGVDPWDEVKGNPELWHFRLHNAPGLVEKLVAGREAVYLDYFLRSSVADPKSISDEDVRRYACAYSRPGRLAAAMGMYRAFGPDERFGRERRGPLDVPIVLAAGGAPDKGFAALLPAMAKGLRDAGVRSVVVETIAGSGHYVVDEQPAQVATLIERYAAR
jgi:pimeloyl-ACP methyl ester carboxylesterase